MERLGADDVRVEGARELARDRQRRDDAATLERFFSEEDDRRRQQLNLRERLVRRLLVLAGYDWWPLPRQRY